MTEVTDKTNYFSDLTFKRSESFHSTEDGKIWTRLLIHLCWWLHDMYEIESTDSNSKFQYLEQQIVHCQALFPTAFTIMISDPTFSPNDQHPLMICRQEEEKIVILVFRATVSSKSIKDVLTDVNIYSNYQVYLGARHSGFSQRVETAPLIAVTNWLRRGWKVIITGHSLGGAVSQLFTTQVITKLVEAGLTHEMVSLRCITFGTPQCADYHFWSNYAEWYDVFDTYIYGNDAIFRLATFGAEVAKRVIDSFGRYLQNVGTRLCANIFGYRNEEQTNVFTQFTDQIHEINQDALIPDYTIFGRHHFIGRDEKSRIKINSIGEQEDEKTRLLEDLSAKRCWHDYFIEKKCIPDQFKFVYREFMEHGCYPFSINQLFNQEINKVIIKKNLLKQKVLRLETINSKTTSNQVSNICGIMNFPDEINLSYIYFQGFLVDFVTSVRLPTELAESEDLRDKKPILFQDQPNECAVTCYKSNLSIKYLQTRPWFPVNVTTYFGCFDVQVVVSSDFSLNKSSIYQLDPIITVLQAYRELVLYAYSVEQTDSPLSHCFSLLFNAFKRMGENKCDNLMARYLAEAQARNFYIDIDKYIQKCPVSDTTEAIRTYFQDHLILLKQKIEDMETSLETAEDVSGLYEALIQEIDDDYVVIPFSSSVEDETSHEESKLIPLYVDFVKLRKYLHELQINFTVSSVQRSLKAIMALFFFIDIKLRRLDSIERHLTLTNKLAQSIQPTANKLKKLGAIGLSVGALTSMIMLKTNPNTIAMAGTLLGTGIATMTGWLGEVVTEKYRHGHNEKVRQSLKQIATSLLVSTGKTVNENENENEWTLISQITDCYWSYELTKAKSVEERDKIWFGTFIKEPLVYIASEYRWNFVGITEVCRQLCAMRRILARQPPKLVIVGQSQTGKSTLFEYLTGRHVEELHNTTNCNIRMWQQCLASIKLNERKDKAITSDSVLRINIIDNPAHDDAPEQANTLLGMSLPTAHLIILVSTLRNINQLNTIELLDRVLRETRVNVLMLINQVDLLLRDAWENYNNRNAKKYNDGDENDSDSEYLVDSFSPCRTLRELMERHIEELIEQLQTDPNVVNNRVTFQSVILKDFRELKKMFDEPGFHSMVHKSNINKWIRRNLINTND